VRELKEEGRIRDDEIVRKVRRKTLPKEKVSKEITEGTKRQDNAQLQQSEAQNACKGRVILMKNKILQLLELFEAGCKKKSKLKKKRVKLKDN